MPDPNVRLSPVEEMDDLYREIILDHHHRPRNRERVLEPDIQARELNPYCGDELDLQLKLEDGRVAQVGVQGQGCSISRASASIMSELLKGKSLEEIAALFNLFKEMVQGRELTEQESERLGELTALSGVRKYPVRIKCALLGWTALEDGIGHYAAGPKRQ